MKQTHRVSVSSVINLKFKVPLQLRRYFRTEMKNRLGPPRTGNILLEAAAHHFIDHLEERDEITLASTVGAY